MKIDNIIDCIFSALKSKTFWVGVGAIAKGAQDVLAGDNSGWSEIFTGLAALTIRHSISKQSAVTRA